MNIDTKSAEEVPATDGSTMIEEQGPAKESVASSRKKDIAAKPNRATGSKSGKAARQPQQSARATSKGAKLVCRYCGGDDLAPSFKKRRDARCRACFKKRYSTARGKRTKRARGAKAGH